jgi:hypothetical protein
LYLNDWMFEADPRVGVHNSSALAHWEATPEELAMVLPQWERPPVFVPPRKRIRAAVKIQWRFRWRVAKLILQCVHRFDCSQGAYDKCPEGSRPATLHGTDEKFKCF